MLIQLRNKDIHRSIVWLVFATMCFFTTALRAELQVLPTPLVTPAVSPVPQAIYKEKEFNFGTVLQGTPVVHSFTFVNSGSAPLVISSVRPACGCTSATLANTQILPGATGEVKITFDTTGFDGAKEKAITVNTNDPAQGSVVFTLKGYVEGTLVFNPSAVSFDNVVTGQGSSPQHVAVAIKNLSDLKITGFRASSPNLVLENGKMNDRVGTFDVRVSPDAPTGRLVERISVDTVRDSGEKNSFVLPITGMVEPTVLVQPRVISFGVINPLVVAESEAVDKFQFSRIVNIVSSEDSPLSVLSIKTSDPIITTELKTVSIDKAYILTVRIDPKRVKKDLRGKVILSTSSKTNALIEIDVFAIAPGEE